MADDAAAFSSGPYWERRYATGGHSGAGSRGLLANYKAAFINRFIRLNAVRSVIDLGCGDGYQIEPLRVRSYLGLDVSPTAVDLCRERYATRLGWRFETYATGSPAKAEHDLALSLDVIYHLVEDDIYDGYMRRLFDSARRHVLVYASDWERPGHVPHIRHRWFSGWVARERPAWRVVDRPANPYPFDEFNDLNTTFASFVAFERDPPAKRTRPRPAPPG
ncbi:class I SAM-dependent methyltransferase [Ancylobacter sp. Lp-2]|uniref:class I SAM-dependent methyltransferase n=1 Tax=Ancylobacter sp. Lp-2 TaxID=2881339 RepID=UPI001E4FCE6A|nr:class I SAM-dependent methyltransferase [Ancylobacter sp. Lp-2]MCB4769812.1 class I SAM-dependent methyltransferase [Ancylobacter sp. Lp-2]